MHDNTIQIKAFDIDFWNFPYNQIKLRQKKNMYPPRVKMTVVMRSDHDLKLPIKIEGCSSNCQLDVELAFPLFGKITYLSVTIISGYKLAIFKNHDSMIWWVFKF